MKINPDVIETITFLVGNELANIIMLGSPEPFDYGALAEETTPESCRSLIKIIFMDKPRYIGILKDFPTLYENVKYDRAELMMKLNFRLMADEIKQRFIDLEYKSNVRGDYL